MKLIKNIVDYLRGNKVTHSFITVTGDKIDCYDSVELLSDEDVIIVAKAKVDGKTKIVTINQMNIQYTVEVFEADTWNQITGLLGVDEPEKVKETSVLYG